MFFTFMRGVVRVVLFIINGRMRLVGKDRLPTDQNYVLVAPHRTWWEPLHLAVAASPKKFSFMAKKELFKNPILSFILKHANAFPVDREKPGPSAIKTPVKTLKDTKLSLVMFPSGTRHSSDLKGGVAVIAKLAKVPIVPSVYQGPLTFKDLLKRKKVTVAFGEPIDISDIKKMDKEGIAEVERRMNEAFAALDTEVDPTFAYEAK
ncbi:lysophospholipid acyltransferase family protein [Candidatus Enterococcus clewellii]|uniref:1-acyl-sn-glycerol-3-phosphate acyltransferase n=1 Tax=Candidatus Enterococcus clewellii TaxID=1834193 RepID=A0A242K7E1_9ENTE|nr:1-acyl-sn-glycerol-3-phosphate acyltransferase [Enterococcus sp. 9E7_DIV0242]OTP15845.1 1-acyl-sn-glycerol-3-phosphate acyltransferase [Enterococcus sp. 9E7_DIV0242]